MFRRTLGVAAVVVSILVLAPPAARAGGNACVGYEEILFCGELNGDCKVSSVDALIALRMSIDLLPDDEAADLDNSFVVTAADSLRILRISVGSSELLLSCGATQYSVKASNVGFYGDDAFHVTNNYATGWYSSTTTELRSYYVFDVSGIPGTVLSARLHLSASPPEQSLYRSSDPTETFRLFAVSTPLATLTNGSAGLGAFADLADGDVYGEFIASAATMKQIVNIPLNSAGVGYVNAQSGNVVFGAAITTLAKGATNENIFNSTGVTNVRELVLGIAQ